MVSRILNFSQTINNQLTTIFIAKIILRVSRLEDAGSNK